MKSLETEYVCVWALHTVGATLDKAHMWLAEEERKLFVESRSGKLEGQITEPNKPDSKSMFGLSVGFVDSRSGNLEGIVVWAARAGAVFEF